MAGSITNPSLGPFPLGMDNRLPDYALFDREAKVALLRTAVNVDVTNNGTLRRRKGRKQLIAGTDCHSLLTTASTGYFVDGTDLKQFTDLDLAPSVVAAGLTAGRRMSYAETPLGEVFCTNGEIIGRIGGGALHPLSPPAIELPPEVAVTAIGTMPAGRYQVATAFVSADGEVGPASPVTQVTLAVPGGLAVTGLPALPVGTVGVNLYVSAANGETLLRSQVATTSSAIVVAAPTSGQRCTTLNKATMPAGQIIRLYGGRILVAEGSMLHFSDPYSQLRTPTKGYIPFPAPITVVEPVNNGVYVVADQAYWFPDDLAKAELAPVLPYGALLGASGQIPNKNACWWMSTRGVIIADQNGEVRNVQEKHIDVGAMASAAGGFVEVAGLKQIIVNAP